MICLLDKCLLDKCEQGLAFLEVSIAVSIRDYPSVLCSAACNCLAVSKASTDVLQELAFDLDLQRPCLDTAVH